MIWKRRKPAPKTDKVLWMVETGIDEEAEGRLLASLEVRDDASVYSHDSLPFIDEDGSGLRGWEPEGPVVYHGSFQGARWVQQNTDWTPGVLANHPAFRCHYYYPFFHEYLLNQRHVMLPFGTFLQRKDDLFEWVGKGGRIFVRPDSNEKPFAGQIVTRETWDEDIKLINFYRLPISELVVVAPPREIRREWRFVIQGRDVLTGSIYRSGQQAGHCGPVTLDTAPWPWEFAQEIANRAVDRGWEPDPVWVLDVCMDSADRLRLLEVGSFACSEFYACDTDRIVGTVTQVAKAAWERRNR